MHVDRERRGAGDADAELAAEPRAHLREDELVRELVLEREPRARRAARALDAAYVPADGDGPEPDPALHPPGAFDLPERVRVDLLVDARHGGEDGRLHRRERLGHARDVGDRRDRRAVMARGLMREARVAVRHRQEEQDDVARHLERACAPSSPR